MLGALRSGGGAAAIGDALDDLRHRWAMERAVAVVDEGQTRQVFVSGEGPWPPAPVWQERPGVYTEPVVPEAAAELLALADLSAIAVRLERLNHDTVHDPLTKLYNRRGFFDHLGQAVGRSTRYGWSFSLMLFDIDYFKKVNDTRGHPYGDEVLRLIGRRLKASLRVGDVAARLGGDEFAVLLADADAGAAAPVLDRLSARSDDNPFGLPVSLSSGTATCPVDAATVDDLYDVADQRLYASKAAGRGEPRLDQPL